MNNDLNDDDDDEDERKPAARPTSNTTVRSPSSDAISLQQPRLKSTTNDNDLSIPPNGDSVDDGGNVVQSVIGEIPFLITHWLTGYSRSSGGTVSVAEDDPPPASPRLSHEARNAAMKQIQKATSDLAAAFQTLGAFGSSKKVSSSRTIALN
jgi:hypothetical protein